MMEQESKYEIDSFMKVATEVMFTQMSAKAGIFFVQKAVEAMVKEYRQIDKEPMEGKPDVATIDPGTLLYKDNRKAIKAVNIIKEDNLGNDMCRRN